MVTEKEVNTIVKHYGALDMLEDMASNPDFCEKLSLAEAGAMNTAREVLEDKFHMEVDCAIDDIEMDMDREIEDSVNEIMDLMRHEYGDPETYVLSSKQTGELFEIEHDLARFMAHWLLHEIC